MKAVRQRQNMKSPDVDKILDELGKPGRMQILSIFFLCVNLWVIIANHLSSIFFAAKTEFSCIKVDTNTSSYVLPLVVTRNEEVTTDDCFVLMPMMGNSTKKTRCSHWTYHLADGETTIISEFDLVCDDAYKSDLATTVYFAGVMIGGVVFGMLADKYGRKRIVILTLLLSGIVGVATFMLRTFAAYIVLRFFLGFFMQGVQNSSYILVLEMISMKYRVRAGLWFTLSGSVGILLLDLLAYVIKDWKYVQLCTGLSPFLLILTSWFVPESLRWHIVQKNFTQAEAIIERIAAFNKLPFPRKLFDEIKGDALREKCFRDEQKGNIIDVFKSPKLRKISFTLFLLWFTFSSGYFGLAFHISFLFGNKYLNLAISTILDTIGQSTLLWIVPRYGRRRPLVFFLFVCAVANAMCSVIASQSVAGSVKFVATTMAIIGKTAIACCSPIAYVFTSELYPTVVRNASLGLNIFWSRVGGMAAPQIFFLGIYLSAFVPYTILTVLTLTSGLFIILLLPETSNEGFTDRLEISMSSLLSCGEDGVTNQSDSGRKKTQFYETSI